VKVKVKTNTVKTNTTEEQAMTRDEPMKTDLLSEIVLLGSSVAVMVALVIVVIAALTSATAAMQ
jgi:hypothetical protein